MFPWSRMPMVEVEGNDSIIDWKLCGWDYENAMSSHHHRGGTSVKLWPRPSSFVLDGTECAVCLNAFGPEGGFHLGTCEHIFHPMCLISLMLCRRRCAVCKAPFHERLYDLFGLVPYMPVSWECDLVNTPDIRTSGETIWCGAGDSIATRCTNPSSAHSLDGRQTTRRSLECAIV